MQTDADLSGLAGLQWKRQLGEKIHVTAAEQRETQTLQETISDNGFTVCPLPLDPRRPAGTRLPEQSASQLHLAQCDPTVLLELESFDFVYVDPHKNPAPYFSSVFRNVRNGGVVCLVVPDTMHFARSPHLVRRCYGAHCLKTEYLKELTVRIILATLATEAARCSKGLTVLYAVSLEDFLLLGVRVGRGPGPADDMLEQNLGHVLHCRICQERAFYPPTMAPVEDPYSLLSCDCHKTVPGKTGVVLGPLWKGAIYDYPCLRSLAESGRTLRLSPSFFSLLHRVMEDCLCGAPPSLHSLQTGHPPPTTSSLFGAAAMQRHRPSLKGRSSVRAAGKMVVAPGKRMMMTTMMLKLIPKVSVLKSQIREKVGALCRMLGGVKRPASTADLEAWTVPGKRSKGAKEPAPCFFYNMHSKRMGTDHLPKHHAIIERLRAQGYRSCRTHFEKYAIRTSADKKTLNALLANGESKVPYMYVKGSKQNVTAEGN
ncbi:hypothetical protein ACOMHN_001586 [Nucella lapillus]